ncbi:MAG: octaprenyl diphosphate synthase [Candidatus Muproteobacteria bacterium RBG_16_65_34]|uniref:Octaprenyl diphosphate synthase n=1 Tax=Candidatus Muproteobacteria bacterium RBG_16_65_34 TaxID=1817760 RepID=A0A1F6TRD3_9PROT|nr:MAG: octaprenyl diphosphate synthase [Candidatus Muproteobacteria bacterium RBG_16_65_34]
MNFEAIRALAANDLQAVDREIAARLKSDVALIDQLGNHIIHSGGKRLRPLIVVLGAHAFGYEGTAHIRLAAIVEFIHTATLLHDDVVDASELRRGQSTANAIWGNEASVLVGDFLYSRAFEMMVEVGSMRVMEILARTTNTIARGEVLQLLNCHDPYTTEERYIEVIRSKTAKLFEAAAQLAAVIGGQNGATEAAMAAYGMHLGTAFQLIDDALDYGRGNQELGKNVGDDLAEGKPTLPLIHALREGTAEQCALIRAAIEEGGLARIEAVVDAIESTGSIAYTARRAEEEAEYARRALEAIPDSPRKQALLDLAFFSVHRNH